MTPTNSAGVKTLDQDDKRISLIYCFVDNVRLNLLTPTTNSRIKYGKNRLKYATFMVLTYIYITHISK